MGCEENDDIPCIFLTWKLCRVNTGLLIPSKEEGLSHVSWDKSLSFSFAIPLWTDTHVESSLTVRETTASVPLSSASRMGTL